MPATTISDIPEPQNAGLEAAALFRALSGDYVSPHPSPLSSPRATPIELPAAMSVKPPSRRRGPVVVKSHQPTPAELGVLGIKTRDYGYNNPLPPLKSYRPPQRQPTPPGRKGLQREDTEPVLDSSQESQPLGGLQYRITEPAFDEHMSPVAGPSRPPVVPTPTVTPNGSLHWATGWPNLSRQNSRLAPQLSVRIEFPPPAVEHSPTTPTSPTGIPARRTIRRRVTRDSPTIAAAGGRTTRSRRKKAEATPGHRYTLRERPVKPPPPPPKPKATQPRKKTLARSPKSVRGVEVSAEANCPTPKRPRHETQAAHPYYPKGKGKAPSRRRS